MRSGKGTESAATTLREGGLVVHPTEAVYGVGGLLSGPATSLLRHMKQRPEGGFVILLPSRDFARGLLFSAGEELADAFWPGALTLVVDDAEDRFPAEVKAPDGSVALRVCGHPITGTLLQCLGEPMSSTSANLPGNPPARTFQEARQALAPLLGSGLAGLDGGVLSGGPPSTLVDVRGEGAEVLREGSVPISVLRRVVSPVATGRRHD